ncbi:hypothetical protein WN943_028835 [Citrus x changshan-huyou]
MALCFLQEIGLADDVLVDEQDIPAPAPPDTRLLRDTPVRRTLPSNIYSSCLVLQEQSFLQRLAKVGNLSGLGRNTCYSVCIIRYSAFLQKNGPRDIGTGDFGATLDGNGSPESFD